MASAKSPVPFDPAPFFPALALIRIPRNPGLKLGQPQANDDFGTGFFATPDGILLTVAHNVTEDGEPGGKPLPWVWVCLYDPKVNDWTDCRRVDVNSRWIDAQLDAAVLHVSRLPIKSPMKLSADWLPEDNVVVLGFQADRAKAGGFSVCPLFCRVAKDWSVVPFDRRHGGGEPVLRLEPVAPEPGLLRKVIAGFSGGPVLRLEQAAAWTIGIEKAMIPADPKVVLGPEVPATAVEWLQDGLMKKLPQKRRPTLAVRQRPMPPSTGPGFERACAAYRRRCQENWDRDFRGETDPSESKRPPYIESQRIELLDDLPDPRPHLSAERFRMRRGQQPGAKPERLEPSEQEKWRPIERAELVQRLVAPLPSKTAPATGVASAGAARRRTAPAAGIRLWCVTHDAGQGKSALLRWLQKEIHQAAPELLALLLPDVRALCGGWEQMIDRLGEPLELRTEEAQNGLAQLIRQGRVVFLVDALDQAPAGIELERLHALLEGAGAGCRFVVAGRPQAIGQHWEVLFQRPAESCPWRFVRMAYFDKAQQRRYLGVAVFERVPPEARDILGVPRALYYLRRLAEKSSHELARVRTASDVYLYTVLEMVRHGLKAEKARGLSLNDALLLLGAVAFEMVAARNFDQVGSGGMNPFLARVADRYRQYEALLSPTASASSRWDVAYCQGRLEQLAAMNEMLSCGLLEGGCPRAIQWRNRSLQEFFAAYWLAQGCSDPDARVLWHWLYLPEERESQDFYWLWRFAAEMPADGCWEDSWVTAMRPVYLPDQYRPPEAAGHAAKRSTEIIYRSWVQMERWKKSRAILEEFQREFRRIAASPNHPEHGTALALLDNFVQCPPDPSQARAPFWMGSPENEQGRDQDEERHAVIVDSFRMAKYRDYSAPL